MITRPLRRVFYCQLLKLVFMLLTPCIALGYGFGLNLAAIFTGDTKHSSAF
jgi:hypothetical protein